MLLTYIDLKYYTSLDKFLAPWAFGPKPCLILSAQKLEIGISMQENCRAHPYNPQLLACLPCIAAGGVVVLGVVVLLGWRLDIKFLYSVIPGLPAMVPNTALGLIFSGIALWLLSGEERNQLRIYAGQGLALGAFLIGVATGVEYLNIAPMLSIDRALVPFFSQEPFVLRPSPQTSIAFAFSSTALFLLGSRKTHAVASTQWLSLLVLMIAVVVLFGYIYEELTLLGYSADIGMALHTVVGFMLLALGMLLAKPEVGLMRAMTGRTVGALVMRRLLPAIVLVPLLFGWLDMLGRHFGLYNEQIGTALLQSLSVIVMAILIAHVARIVNREEQLKQHAEEKKRQHETELAHRDRLHTMGEMASGIVHEVNQPLTAISVYAVTLKRILGDMENIPPDVLRSLERIGTQAGLATEIIQRMRVFSRKQCPPKSRVLAPDVIGEVVKLIEHAAQRHAVQLRLSLDADLPPIEMDTVQIEQVLLNIVRNAIEAMQAAHSEEKIVTIRAYLNSAQELQVDIRDTGPGMDAETLSHVFEPFFSTKGAAGMGLGLAISQTIIAEHGGRFWAESTPGQGACFSFTLSP
jgi:signal transduction histidine kinase